MRVITAMAVALAAFGTQATFSVEPAYKGPLGNNEEPATRPYKWVYRGLRSLVYHTGDQFVEGNMRTPALGSVQGLRGLRRGTVELGESTYHGLVYAPAPDHKDYKNLSRANTIIENDLALRNGADFLFSWYFFPAQKVVDRYPLEGDTKVDLRDREAESDRMARAEAAEVRSSRDPSETDVKRAQRSYIGDRADLGTKKTTAGRGNLMKLAR